MTTQFSFGRVQDNQRDLIHRWLQQEHISEWLHGEGLQNTLNSLDESFKGDSFFQHWIAYEKGEPFAYLLTSYVEKDTDDPYTVYCEEEGKAITLDLFICDVDYMGKGLAVPMIQEFLKSQFGDVSEVFIDPEVSNTRATHVYQKAGFKILKEFIPLWHSVPHFAMRLKMKELINDTKEKI